MRLAPESARARAQNEVRVSRLWALNAQEEERLAAQACAPLAAFTLDTLAASLTSWNGTWTDTVPQCECLVVWGRWLAVQKAAKPVFSTAHTSTQLCGGLCGAERATAQKLAFLRTRILTFTPPAPPARGCVELLDAAAPGWMVALGFVPAAPSAGSVAAFGALALPLLGGVMRTPSVVGAGGGRPSVGSRSEGHSTRVVAFGISTTRNLPPSSEAVRPATLSSTYHSEAACLIGCTRLPTSTSSPDTDTRSSHAAAVGAAPAAAAPPEAGGAGEAGLSPVVRGRICSATSLRNEAPAGSSRASCTVRVSCRHHARFPPELAVPAPLLDVGSSDQSSVSVRATRARLAAIASSGLASIAEGLVSIAEGLVSIAEGLVSIAEGLVSIARGARRHSSPSPAA